MTCKQCKYITMCMEEADSLGQVFDTNYDGEHGCTDFVQFTNADRIRAMSDEELADMLWKTGRNYRAVCADPVVDYNEHRDNLIAWLKQPAKGE